MFAVASVKWILRRSGTGKDRWMKKSKVVRRGMNYKVGAPRVLVYTCCYMWTRTHFT